MLLALLGLAALCLAEQAGECPHCARPVRRKAAREGALAPPLHPGSTAHVLSCPVLSLRWESGAGRGQGEAWG